MGNTYEKNEMSYRVISIAISKMLSTGLITEQEYNEARKALIRKLKPLIGSLEYIGPYCDEKYNQD